MPNGGNIYFLRNRDFFVLKSIKKCYYLTSMQVDYSKLWERYKEKGYKNKTDLISLADVSTNIVAKLNKGELLSKEYYADFVCYDKIIVELKAVTSLVKAHKAQVINYLKAADKEIGLLVNFGCNSLKWERISKFETRENR